ncbi:hypothetical protein K470DRAFT_219312 [Piedraia hortae CBS 480.64]|uniref:Uncharacterized protein n=1 Tax=Piedraia hortae CBS 480.64 TaxID=1314780 RepID=A0A6A7BX88_9PEZI|nr:hypothetical protein K470DRAFT_219312 [Piedraia hortae CBS 480.64]
MFTESHSDSVTCLGFYGTGLLSGGADGLVNVFDLTKGEDEDEALEWVGNVRGAVNRCVWMEGGRGVGVVTTDEKFNVYDLKGGGERDWGDVRGILGAKYCVGLGEWRGGSVLLYGDNSLGTLAMADVHHLRDGERVEFPGGHGEDVVRDFVLYDDRAYTCGEDGAVRLWRF